MASLLTPATRCTRAASRSISKTPSIRPFPHTSRRCLYTSNHDQQSAVSTTHSLPPDFLLPWPSTRLPLSRSLNGPRRTAPLPPNKRRFFSTPSTHATVLANPRVDEEGKPMHIDISPRAAQRLSEIVSSDSNPALALRVTVESGGCHGFQYLMSLTSPTAPIAPDDTVFEAADGSGARVVMDGPSLELLKGSRIDYTDELIGSQFKIVDNPLATSSCGCGTSFDVKA
ncbi:MAG: [4Fe-4S] proteins maturation [Thelocarpon impressellum]|nr:MAG: [4Fe-4S] proteins maturation [Thelocarpon impressellum]